MKLDPQQSAALDLLQSGANVFLTGSAGTGKSTVTTAFVGSAMRRVDITATTGVAAINLRDSYRAKSGGRIVNVRTIYSFAGIGLGPKPDQSFESYWNWWRAPMSKSKLGAFRRIQGAECVIIDEISMFPGHTFGYLDYHFKKIRNDDRPFGGVQMVTVGDFLQLPPVAKDNRTYDWAFLSRAWQEAGFKPANLTTVHRQDEADFINLLNDFRRGRISTASMEAMKPRVTMFPSAKIPRLMTHNLAVDKWNRSQLESLPGESITFTARIKGDQEKQRDWLIKNLVTPYALELRPGARIMVTANLIKEGELVASNGTLGTLLSCDVENERVEIETDDGRVLSFGRWMWEFDPQDEESAKFYQFPLRLAWASTIHKSQGLTLDAAVIDIRSAREPGQAYVALSRVRSLAGLHLKSAPAGVVISQAAVAFHDEIARASAAMTAEAVPAAELCDY